MEVKVNINDYVKVKLTPLGWKILKTNYKTYNQLSPRATIELPTPDDSDGYVTMQLSELMAEFGKYIINDHPNVIETEIILLSTKPIENNI